MDPALYEPVEVTDMRLVAKAAIVVYREIATGKLWIDPDLNQNPLFRLGDVKGDKGDTGEAGDQGIQGETGAAGTNANPAAKLTGSTLNVARAGVVLGLAIQSVNSEVPLIGAIVVFRGLLKLVSTATGTASMQANIGGLIFTFPNITLAANTQYVHFEVSAHVISAAVGFASVRQSIALNGVAANAVQANNVAQSGAASTNTALIQFKSPTTTQVTTLLAVCEVL